MGQLKPIGDLLWWTICFFFMFAFTPVFTAALIVGTPDVFYPNEKNPYSDSKLWSVGFPLFMLPYSVGIFILIQKMKKSMILYAKQMLVFAAVCSFLLAEAAFGILTRHLLL